jgi:hypothetical protein
MKKLSLIILLLALMLTGCKSQAAQTSESLPPSDAPAMNSTEPTQTPTPSPESTPEPFRKLLTGEVIPEKPENLRPYAVMINNISLAQPQVGISKADIIYEVLAEGEITRMLAVFSEVDGVGVIGSMRSARPYYIEIARSYDAIFVHAGGSDDAYYDISIKGVNNIDGVRGAYGGEIFYRDPNRMQHGIEHSLFTTSELLLQYTPILGYASEHSEPDYSYGLSFSDEPTLDGGVSAAEITVSFGGLKTTSFSYDDAKEIYTASQYGSGYIDGATEKPVEFRNVLTLYAETSIIDSYGRRVVKLTGSGEGHFFCKGQKVDITWHREGDGKQFSYTLADGAPLTLGVGKSYIAIVPTGSEISN